MRRPESGTTTGPAGWPTGPAGQGEAWVARGTGITQLAALAQVWAARSTSGGPGQRHGTRIPTGSWRATAISSQSVKSVGQSARGGHHSAGRPGRNQSRHKSVADKFSPLYRVGPACNIQTKPGSMEASWTS